MTDDTPSERPLAPARHPQTSTDRLRQYSRLGTNEALAALGDPDHGDPRSASAVLELDSVISTGPDAKLKHRRMKVGVTLSISNDGSCPPPPDSPDDPLCPPKPQPDPNRPPYPPRPCRSSRWPWAIVVLLLAVLALLALNDLGRKHDETGLSALSGTTGTSSSTNPAPTSTSTADNSQTQVASSVSQSPSAVPISPTALRLDDTVMPVNAVILDQSPNAACDGAYHDLNQVPPFAVAHTQNWVRTAATQWQVRCVENLGGATVVALDATHNVINRQIYGANFQFVEQLTFVQSTDGAGFRTLQVDFYAPFNTFTGRTIYRFDSSNHVSDAYRQDGFQRPLQQAHFTRDRNGVITAIDTEKTPRNGGGRERAYTKSDIEAATRVYYAFDSLN